MTLNEWETKGNRRCEGGYTVVSSILPFQVVFAFKETSDRPEYSRRRRGEALSHVAVVDAGGGVLCRGNTKTGTQVKERPSQNVVSVEKLVKVCVKGVIQSILLT